MAAAPRTFVPQDLDLSDPAKLEPIYRELIDRLLKSVGDLKKWFADLSELWAAVSEFGARRYIELSCHTDDPKVEEAYMHQVEVVDPALAPLFFEIQKKYVECPFRSELPQEEFGVLDKAWTADVELFRPENIPLQTKASKLAAEYDKLNGAMTVEFQGAERTLPQMGRFQEDLHRETRQQAWEAVVKRRLENRERLDAIYDELIQVRTQIAKNAGFSDFREYVWKSLKRFDYTPQDCHDFAKAVAETVTPVVAALCEDRREKLGVSPLRPWDLEVDAFGKEPLNPFPHDDAEVLRRKVGEIVHRISPELGADYDHLKPTRNLDLASRKGKGPGAYQSSLQKSREPFIFMNAAGLHSDVITLLHEAGHAFHFIEAADEPIAFIREAPIEFCEVASMSMELLALPHLEVFYNQEDAARATRSLLERIVRLLPWIATIDQFQHWVYTHPNHSHEDRTAEWLRLRKWLGPPVDWSGYEDAQAAEWQRQLHLFSYPFYYIEYAIAQLGALQVWLASKTDCEKATADYRKALALGGKAPLPDLFAAAGAKFDFSRATLGPLMKAVSDELAASDAAV
ncbi:MAG TPA: M3 family oligoendopeptidase [Pirellulales bacterium]